VSRTIILL